MASKGSRNRLTDSQKQAISRDERQARRAKQRDDPIIDQYKYDGRIVTEEMYWELVNEYGAEVVSDNGKDDPYIKALLDFPMSSDIWYTFYENYIHFIEEGIKFDKLSRYDKSLAVSAINLNRENAFMDNDYELLVQRIQQYELVMNSLKSAAIAHGHFNMSNTSRDALSHLLESLDKHIRILDDVQCDYFYAHLVTIVELMFNPNIFNAFMADPNDNKFLKQDKICFTAIWIRRGTIWGIGEHSYAHGGLRNFIQNYFRQLINYAVAKDIAFNVVAINPNKRTTITGGKTNGKTKPAPINPNTINTSNKPKSPLDNQNSINKNNKPESPPDNPNSTNTSNKPESPLDNQNSINTSNKPESPPDNQNSINKNNKPESPPDNPNDQAIPSPSDSPTHTDYKQIFDSNMKKDFFKSYKLYLTIKLLNKTELIDEYALLQLKEKILECKIYASLNLYTKYKKTISYKINMVLQNSTFTKSFKFFNNSLILTSHLFIPYQHLFIPYQKGKTKSLPIKLPRKNTSPRKNMSPRVKSI